MKMTADENLPLSLGAVVPAITLQRFVELAA